jgi:hypothetical protein
MEVQISLMKPLILSHFLQVTAIRLNNALSIFSCTPIIEKDKKKWTLEMYLQMTTVCHGDILRVRAELGIAHGLLEVEVAKLNALGQVDQQTTAIWQKEK